MHSNPYDLIVIGGGAAGVFAAICAKEACPTLTVLLLEKSNSLLSKVKISGGGRCNVTHNCFDPQKLILNYPRGSKELLGPFQRFHPGHTVSWFKDKGVALKSEADGRMFPVADDSQVIIDCLQNELTKNQIEVFFRSKVQEIDKENELFVLTLREGKVLNAKNLLVTTGSAPEGYDFAKKLGHTIEPLVPSLFTFNVPSSSLKALSGISVEKVLLKIENSRLMQEGPILITHFGFSGPAVLKLSAWGARFFHEQQYSANLHIDWLYPLQREETLTQLMENKKQFPNKSLLQINPFSFPKNLWKTFLEREEGLEKLLGEVSLKLLRVFNERMHKDIYRIEGKTTHKEEFVTCGGVRLSEVNFKRMESKICKNLFFAGEILDIDGLTGGFNFQNAWTTAYLAAWAIALPPAPSPPEN